MPNTHSTLTSLFSDIANAIRAKKGTSADIVADNFPSEIASIPSGGITPTGNINITDTNPTDVTNYATATIVDADLVAENIKKDVNILGVVGSFEGGGGANIVSGTFTPAENTGTLTHNADFNKYAFSIWADGDLPSSSTYSIYSGGGYYDGQRSAIGGYYRFRYGAPVSDQSAFTTATKDSVEIGAKFITGVTYNYIIVEVA